MKKQKTFNTSSVMMEWLTSLSQCFDIKSVTITKHQVEKKGWDTGIRYKVTVNYK